MLHCLDYNWQTGSVEMWKKNIFITNVDKPYNNSDVKENKKDINREQQIEAENCSDKSQAIEDEIMWMRRIISHNVRMPMAIIKGYGDVLKQDLLGEKERQKAIDSIYENILYLDQILSVVFDYGETKEVTLVKVNLCEVIRKVIGYVKEISRNNGIKITLNTEKEELFIEAELTPIIRIFYQLLENSFKYLSEGNNVHFSIYSLGDEVLVVYKDDGIGINDEDVPYIFDKGFRGSNSQNKTGSGYGLFEVLETVKKYKGNIEIKSHIGHGLSIFIKFPAYI